MRALFASIGFVAAVVLVVIALILESLIPGAIIHFAAGVGFVTAVFWSAVVQLGLLIAAVVMVVGLTAASS